MCGIVGYIGNESAQSIVISGLEKLEYRGYDSAGIAVIEDGKVEVSRARGKLAELKKVLDTKAEGSRGTIGIGHTRWATHGKPSENNAHPHSAGRVSLIHNGIIENYIELRDELIKAGVEFSSETDTEIAAHLLSAFLQEGHQPFEALKLTCAKLRGSYAFLAIDKDHPDRILVAKNATPIVIGLTKDSCVVASDIPAVLPYTREVVILEDGDIAEVKVGELRIENNGSAVTREVEHITWDPVTAQKGGFKHYMLKEIHEQSLVLGESFRGRVNIEDHSVSFGDVKLTDQQIRNLKRIVLSACGTAWHSCLVAKYYLEELCGVPCDVDYASEFRYRQPVLEDNTLFIVVSQSGETADSLAALQLASERCETLAICNVLGSSIARKANHTIFTHAGPEISVASTKAFTTQLVCLYLFALYIGEKRGVLSETKRAELIQRLIELPAAADQTVKECESAIKKIAKSFYTARDFLYLGRGVCFPIALEGALKLKEISYIHAEGYPAGEMKHGPIALIDANMPIVVVMQNSPLFFDKSLSNLREVQSREGRIIAVTDVHNNAELNSLCEAVIEVPFISEHISPLLLTLPLQLLAYYIAVLNGTDVDLPRNLAKSVTVE